jgi:hypothetical protein
MNTFYRPRFVTIYVFLALGLGLTMCWIWGWMATKLVEPGIIASRKPTFPLGIWPTFLCMGSPLVAFGIIVLATIWFMRKGGVVLALLMHLAGIIMMAFFTVITLINALQKPWTLILTLIFVMGIVAQLYFIYWFVLHWSLFRWIRFEPRPTPDMLQIVDNPQ